MIDFRYHVVSLVAVFLALAIGILLGSGPLKEPIEGTLRDQAQQLQVDKEQLRSEINDLQNQVKVGRAFATQATAPLVRERLATSSVVLVSLPDVPGDLLDDLSDTLKEAGATVSGRVAVTDTYLDPQQTSTLDELVSNPDLLPPGVNFGTKATPYSRAATVLARSLVTRDPSRTNVADQDAAALLAGLKEIKAITFSGTPARRAALALVVAPKAPDPAPKDAKDVKETSDRNAALLPLLTQLDAQSRGAVVAGPSGSAGDGGFLAAVRASGGARRVVSTVDLADTPEGRVGSVLALVEQGRGATGQYGEGDGTDAVVPDLVTEPRS